jgi:uncharacterized protein YecE (DUF72 family)
VSPVIGTAGWAIPAIDKDIFPLSGTLLQRYASVLRGVEVNSSFHRPHRRSTWERWAGSVPESFRFAVKMPKQISHVHRIVDVHALLEQFVSQVGGLGDKLELLLLQLPPSLKFDRGVMAAFLDAVTSLTDTPIVCEPRHCTWFGSEASTLLAERRVARVAADPSKVPDGDHPGGWRGTTYIRLHGSPDMYRSAYDEDRLRSYASQIADDSAAGRSVWCMFDNTAASAALGDALKLITMLESSYPCQYQARALEAR